MEDCTPVRSSLKSRRNSKLHTPVSLAGTPLRQPRPWRSAPRNSSKSPSSAGRVNVKTEPRKRMGYSPQNTWTPPSKRCSFSGKQRLIKSGSKSRHSASLRRARASLLRNKWKDIEKKAGSATLPSQSPATPSNCGLNSFSPISGHRFGFIPGREDTMAFNLPPFRFDVQKEALGASEPESQIPLPGAQNTETESTAVIFGFASPPALPAMENLSTHSTEVLFPSKVSGWLSPVLEEDSPRQERMDSLQILNGNKTVDSMDEDTARSSHELVSATLRDSMGNAVNHNETKMDVDSEVDCGEAIRALRLGDDETPASTCHVRSTLAPIQERFSEVMEDTMSESCQVDGENKIHERDSAPTQSPVSFSFPAQRKSERKSLPMSSPAREPTWEDDMLRYLEGRKVAELDLRRKSLFNALSENCTSAQNWQDFLTHEETVSCSKENADTNGSQPVLPTNSVSLFNLYQWAVELVPESADGYTKLWIGYCRWLWMRNQTEALAMLRSRLISSAGCESLELLTEAAQCSCSLGEQSTILRTINLKIRWAKLQSRPTEGFEALLNGIVSATLPPYCPGEKTK